MRDYLSRLFPYVKEPLRLVILGLLSWGLIELSSIENPEQWMVVLMLVLRSADKWLHELGKATNNSLMTRGITQF